MLGQTLCSFGEYTFHIIDSHEFFPMYEAHQARVFQDSFNFRFSRGVVRIGTGKPKPVGQ